MSNRKISKRAFCVLLVGLILVGCGGAEAEPTATSTPIPPTSTPLPPTSTSVPPTSTPLPPTATPIPPTSTPLPPTSTPVPPTSTPIPPTSTPVPPTEPPASPTPESASVTARIKTDLRDGPGPRYKTVGELSAGETELVSGRNADNSWWQINFQGGTAWIRNSVVTASAGAYDAPISSGPPTPTPRPIVGAGRRVVTGVDAQGRSTILMDDRVDHFVWRIPLGPADLADDTDPVESWPDGMPDPRWIELRIVIWRPGEGFEMHSTPTLDFACSLSGQIELILENGSTLTGPGECVIQRGTQHAWRVGGDKSFVGIALAVGAAHQPPRSLVPPSVTTGVVGPGRRVVTGVDADGKSTVLTDDPLPDNATLREAGATVHAIWRLPPGPADLSDETDPIESFSWATDQYPPPGGVEARIVAWEPGYQESMHQTDTLDFVCGVSGQAELILDTASTVIGPKECLIQRGTVHGWRVVGDEPFTAVVFMVGAAR